MWVTPFYRYLNDYWELERVLGCFEKLWSPSTSTLHRRSIDVPSTRNLGGIKIHEISKIIKISLIFSKNRSKIFLKHFFENLSCAFLIGIIVYRKQTFPEVLEARNPNANSFENDNSLENFENPSKRWSLVWPASDASMARQWIVNDMTIHRMTKTFQNNQELLLTQNIRRDIHQSIHRGRYSGHVVLRDPKTQIRDLLSCVFQI